MNRTIILSALAVVVSLTAIVLSLSVGSPPMPPPEPGTRVPLSRSTVGPVIRINGIRDGSEQAPRLQWSHGGDVNMGVAYLDKRCVWVIEGKERPEYKVPPEVCEWLRGRALTGEGE